MRPWREDELDEEGRPFELPVPRPLTLQDYVLLGLVLAMVVVVLALAGGAWR